ncbi:beta strand repeat-containing protein [Aquabacterium sp. OR-4]|uniref:beta strand repeat-containing protein n=1 Tax=Aquabacterium sp. OR-4 TaxID=2978127 RepID=UPI0028C54CA3|nr:filamentous hemagglutinin N-terminal domain-containing protein [Aquabacterium sp. OR-4]MDT7836071.1 filamentous hemagglutinin N-terminal domain-containing protein [Aquabacterium sp. OR-4]
MQGLVHPAARTPGHGSAAGARPGQARRRPAFSPRVLTPLALTPLARAILAAGLLASPLLLQAAGPLPALASGALPTGLQVRAGQAAVQTTGQQMVVRNSPGAILNWKSFDIGAAASVRFDQANAASKVLNRVTGDDPSRILGRLSSNGQVWLLNPNGVLFGQGARVDVAGLVSSTLRLGDSDFLAQRYRFTADEGLAATVRNEGALQSSFGGQVLLLGGRVENHGDILAPGGQVALGAASAVDLVDTGLPNLAVRVAVPAGEVLNLGRLAAAGGRVDVYGAIVNQQGLVSALSLGQGAEGQLVLRASDTLSLGATSRTEASGLDVGQRGGDVTLQGRHIALAAGATVEASGDAGGGRIRVGGGLQGRDTDLANAATVQVAAGALLAADALGQGRGGQVMVWSDQLTRFEGLLRARGGALGGDGGFAEVSSKGELGFNGLADLRAVAGAAGSLLLDPSFLTIAATGANLSGQGDDLGSGSVLFGQYPRINSVITAGALNTQLALGNVLLQADNDITVNAPVEGSNALTLQAGRHILVNSSVRAASGIHLSANDPGGADSGFGVVQMAASASLDAGSGTLTISHNGGSGTHRLAGALSAGTLAIEGPVQLMGASTWTLSGDSTVASAISGNQGLTKAGSGTLTLAGSNNYGGGTTVAQGTLATAAADQLPDLGTLTVAAGASLALGGNDSIGALAGAGNVVLGDASLVSDASSNTSFSGRISGAGGFTKQGSGWLTLSGSNTYTGMTTVRTDSGRLIVAGTGEALPGALTIDGGRVVLDNSSRLTLPSLSMVGGWLSGTGEVLVSGPFTVSGSSAEINGSGSFATRGASSINLERANSGFLGVSKPWTNTGTLTLAGDDYLFFGYSQGTGGSLTNAAGGSVVLATSAASAMRVYTGASNVFSNAGSLRQTATGAHAIDLNTFTNTGTVEVQAGTLELSANGTDSGLYRIDAGATLAVTGGTRQFASGIGVSGSGTLQVAGGTLNLGNGSAITLANLQLSGGELTGSGDLIVSGAFSVDRSQVSLGGSGTLTTEGNSTVNLSAGGSFLGLGRTWVNRGILSISGDDFIYLGYPSGGSPSLLNAAGATLNLDTSAATPLALYTGTPSVINQGTLNHNTAARQLVNVLFSNSGTLNQNAGTLVLSANGSDSGRYNVASGATLEIGGGTRVLGSSANVAGAGSLLVSGGTTTIEGALDLANTGAAIGVSNGTLNFGGSASGNFAPVTVSGGTLNFNNSATVTVPSLTLSAGTLGGSGNLTVSGAFDVTGRHANLDGSGTLTTRGSSTVDMAEVNGGYLGIGRNWLNEGTLTFGGNDFAYIGYPSGSAVTLTNAAGATLNLNTSATNALAHYSGSTAIVNQGTLNHNAAGRHTVSAATAARCS